MFMSKFSEIARIDIPSFNLVYDNFGLPNIIIANTNVIKNIKTKYAKSIEKWGDAFELFEPLVVTLIAIESRGEAVGKNSAGAIGVMQVKEITVRESVSRFQLICKTKLPEVALQDIKQKAPYLLALSVNEQKLSSSNTVKLEKLLKDDIDFNIMIGCLCFRFALDFTKANGECQINKAIIAYNTGVYGKINSKYKNQKPSTLSLYKDKSSFVKETRDYLAKALGVNGYWSLYAKLLN